MDPESVHASWRAYFNNIDRGAADPYTVPPTLGKNTNDNANL